MNEEEAPKSSKKCFVLQYVHEGRRTTKKAVIVFQITNADSLRSHSVIRQDRRISFTETTMNKWSSALGTVLLTLCLAGNAAAAGPPVPAIKPVLDKFPIVAWGHSAPTEVGLKAYQDAHFNIVQVPAGEADAIRRANVFGFRVMIVTPEAAGASPTEWTAYAQKFENVMGWSLGSAIAPADAVKVSAGIRGLRTVDAQRWALASIPPSDAGDWGTTLGELLRAGVSAIVVERHDWRADGTDDTKSFFSDLEAARQISAKVKAPLWGTVHVARSGPYRWASASDMRVHVYSALAAGAKGLCYLTRWPTLDELATAAPDEGEDTLDLATLTRRNQYEMDAMRAINQEVLTLAPSLLGLKSVGLYAVGNEATGLPPLDRSGQLVASVTAENAIVGILIDDNGKTWAMVVNGRHGKQKAPAGQKSTLRIAVDPRVTQVVEIDRVTAYRKEIPLDNGAFFITLPGGTGSLLQLETVPTPPTK